MGTTVRGLSLVVLGGIYFGQTLGLNCLRSVAPPIDVVLGKILGADGARRQLHCYYQNVRGLRSTLNKFYLCVLESNLDIFACTLLNDGSCDAELFPDSCSGFRGDRDALGNKPIQAFRTKVDSIEELIRTMNCIIVLVISTRKQSNGECW